MNPIRLLILLSGMFSLLVGCGDSDELADLKAYVQEARQKPKGTIEPLPTFTGYDIFVYGASTLRSPFQLTVKSELVKQPKNSNIKPDEKRLKQFLENFNIDELAMVGTLSNNSKMFALIRGPEGIYRVKAGDYLGRNHGRIVSINADRIEVVEIVPDGDGGWSERPQILPLKERSS